VWSRNKCVAAAAAAVVCLSRRSLVHRKGPASIPAAPEGTVFMYILAAMLGFSFLNAIYYKWCTKSLVFLLQVGLLSLVVSFCFFGLLLT